MTKQPPAPLSASVLGRLLLLPSALGELPDEPAIFALVGRALTELPGVAAACFTAQAGGAAQVRLPLDTGHSHRGELYLTLSDPAAFAPYEPYLRNFCFVLAVLLEERSLHRHDERPVAKREDRQREPRHSMLSRILDLVPQAIFWKDTDGTYLGCNRAFAEAAGYSLPANIIGHTDFDLPWTHAQATSYRTDDCAVQERNCPKLHIVEPILQSDGTRHWIETSKMPLTDDSGRVCGVLGIFHDITERKQVDEALRQSELFLSRSQAVGQIGSYILDLAGDQPWTSTPIMDSILGIPPDYPKNDESWMNLIVERDAVRHHMEEQVLAQHRPFDREYHIVRPCDGQTRWIHGRGELEFDPRGNPARLMGTVQDITERKQAEEQNRQLADERRTILDTITAGIAFLKDRKHEWVNPAFARMFGYEPAELKGLDSATFYANRADYERVGREGYPLLASGGIYASEVEMVRRDGTKLWCLITGRAIAPGNLAAGSIWALHDITERKRAEAALRESEAAFRSLFEASPTPITLMVDRKLIRVNPKLCQSTGYSEAELLGQSPRMLYPDDATFDRVGAELYGRLAREGSSTTEARMLRKNGEPIDVLISISLLDPANPAKGIAATLIDITERKLAEESYRTIVQTAIDGFWTIDRQGRIRSVNESACRMLGYSREELLALSIPDLEANEDRTAVTAHLAHIARTGRDRFETRLRRKDNTLVDTEISINHLPGVEPRFFIFIRDISERKNREEALHRSEERFRLAIEHTGQLVYDFDLSTGKGQWSGTTEAMLGYSAEFLAAQAPGWWFEQVHPDNRAALTAGWEAIIHDNRIQRTIYRFRRADATWVHLMASSVRINDAEGRPIRILGAIADVTKQQEDAEAIRRLNAELEQRVRDRTAQLEHLNADLRASQDDLGRAAARLQEANANLLAANQELESFSYSVSHDLRAPLRNIAGFIELLRKRTAGQLDPEVERYFGIIGTEAVRMATLIDDLLTFSRIGRAELHFAPIQLATLVAEVQAELQTELSGRQIEWSLQPLPSVLGDRTLLRQVVANLLANAVKFTRKRPQAIIEIGTEPAGSGSELITFFVRDNGAGFDPKYAAKLFGVFQRLHNPRDFEGTGIGLANVKRIVERHGGRVWAEGSPDQGATFHFSLRPATR